LRSAVAQAPSKIKTTVSAHLSSHWLAFSVRRSSRLMTVDLSSCHAMRWSAFAPRGSINPQMRPLQREVSLKFDPPGVTACCWGMISPGTKLNLEFPVKVWSKGEAREARFGELLTRRTIVSVYMKNNTPSCDRQNESLVEHAARFAAAGYDLIALSRDTCGSHGRYAAAKSIPYLLVSDPKDQFALAADSLVAKSMYGRSYIGPARAAFVLDPDGTVVAIAEKVDTVDHAGQLLTLIAGLRP